MPTILSVRDGEGRAHLVRLLTWLPGSALAEVRAREPAWLNDVGHMLGVVDNGLESFAHPETGREFFWDIRHAGSVIRREIGHIPDAEDRALVERCLHRFEEHVAPVLPELRVGVIHNDGNDWNVLVDRVGGRVVGLLDFGDLVRTCTVFEAATASAYASLDQPDPLAAAGSIRPSSRCCSPRSARGWPSASASRRGDGQKGPTTPI
jgi:Ser/Thr protein kinase RdoA (MazF antagonist)